MLLKSFLTKHYSPIIASAVAIVLVNAIAIFGCHIFKKKEAERYFHHFEPVKFYVMQMCYMILVIALSYDVRFLVARFIGFVWKKQGVKTLKTLTPTLHSNLKKAKII